MAEVTKLPENKKTSEDADVSAPKPETKAKVKTRDVRLSVWEIETLRAILKETVKNDLDKNPDALFYQLLEKKLEASDAIWVRMPADHPLATR